MSPTEIEIYDDVEIISFVDVILGLSREKNIDLYVTGSNSKMLSTDIVTAFPDEGQMLENIVYNEMIYNGYTVNVGAFDSIEKIKKGDPFVKATKLTSTPQKVFAHIIFR